MIRVLFLLSAFSAFSPSPASDEDIQYTEDVLGESRYRFCHEDDYPLIDSERSFCAFVDDETASRCPKLAEVCRHEPEEVDSSDGTPIEMRLEPGARGPTGRQSGGDERTGVRRVKTGTGDGERGKRQGNDKPSDDGKTQSGEPNSNQPGDHPAKTSSGETPKPPEPPPPPPKPDPEVPAAASGLARILFFVLLIGFILFIVRMILKNVLSDADAPPEEVPPDEVMPTAPTNALSAARGAIETDVERLLARARAAAQRGAFAPAIDDLYAALLRRLDGDGIIQIQPFRTNGDYLREVRRERSAIAPEVRAILSDVESVHFGARSPSAELFSRLHERIVPLVSKALGIVFFLVAISATTACGHVAAAQQEEDDAADAHDGLGLTVESVFRGDSSPSGIHAIAKLLEPVDVDMRQHRNPLEKLPDPGISTLVLLPGFDIDDIGARELQDWVKRGGHLVFAGGFTFPAWAGASFDLGKTSQSPARPTGRYVGQFGTIELQIPAGSLLQCAPDEAFLRRGADCYAAQHPLDDGRVFVFADDRWFMNITLAFGDNSAFLISFFRAVHRNVHVLDGQTSLGANTPIQSIARANLWPILLQLFLLLGAAFLWQGVAFGTLRDPKVESRRAFADHVRALGQAYARAGASRHVLGIYAGWAIERLRERLPREGRRGLSGLAEALATRTGRSTGEVMSALVEITDAQREAAPNMQRSVVAPTRAPRRDKLQAAGDFALFRALDQWLASTSRDKRSSSRSTDKKTKRSS